MKNCLMRTLAGAAVVYGCFGTDTALLMRQQRVSAGHDMYIWVCCMSALPCLTQYLGQCKLAQNLHL